MTNGRTGHMDVELDGKSYIVLYRPLEGTEWSVALVCPSNELLRGYNRLNYILLPLLFIGLAGLGMPPHREALRTAAGTTRCRTATDRSRRL